MNYLSKPTHFVFNFSVHINRLNVMTEHREIIIAVAIVVFFISRHFNAFPSLTPIVILSAAFCLPMEFYCLLSPYPHKSFERNPPEMHSIKNELKLINSCAEFDSFVDFE